MMSWELASSVGLWGKVPSVSKQSGGGDSYVGRIVLSCWCQCGQRVIIIMGLLY